ncbi:MAG: hypothetical protein ABIB71_00535 [Candidatus Woesearchaeota archaeon]
MEKEVLPFWLVKDEEGLKEVLMREPYPWDKEGQERHKCLMEKVVAEVVIEIYSQKKLVRGYVSEIGKISAQEALGAVERDWKKSFPDYRIEIKEDKI